MQLETEGVVGIVVVVGIGIVVVVDDVVVGFD